MMIIYATTAVLHDLSRLQDDDARLDVVSKRRIRYVRRRPQLCTRQARSSPNELFSGEETSSPRRRRSGEVWPLLGKTIEPGRLPPHLTPTERASSSDSPWIGLNEHRLERLKAAVSPSNIWSSPLAEFPTGSTTSVISLVCLSI